MEQNSHSHAAALSTPSGDSTPPIHPSLLSAPPSPPIASPLPALPLETLSDILNHALEDPSPLNRQKNRISFSSVCRAWYHETRNAQSGECCVDGNRRGIRLTKALEREEKRRMEGKITSRPGITSLVLLEDEVTTSGRNAAFATLIRQLPDLLHFSFVCQNPQGHSTNTFGSSVLDALGALSKLERFSVLGPCEAVITPLYLLRLLADSPRLVDLDIPALHVRGPAWTISPPISLRTLTCRLEVMEQLSLSGLSSLRTLSIIVDCCRDWRMSPHQLDAMAAAASIAANALEELIITVESNYGFSCEHTIPLHAAFATLTSLKRLVVPFVFIGSAFVKSLEQIPLLEELDASTVPYFWREYSRFPALTPFVKLAPKLKRLKLPGSMFDEFETEGDVFVDIALKEGVELIIVDSSGDVRQR